MTILTVGTIIKFIMMIFCYKYGTSSNSKVLALDQRNDVITNIVALACALIGYHYWLYADPLGAILVRWARDVGTAKNFRTIPNC